MLTMTLVTLSLAAAGPTVADFFPVAVGVTLVSEEGITKERVVSKVLAPVKTDGGVVYPRVVTRGDGSTRGRFFALSVDSFSLIAVSRPAEAAPQPIPAVPFLVGPIAVGTKWQIPYALQSLDQRIVTLNARIASVTDTVETRAGKFGGCLRVEATATATQATARADVTDTTFICPAVGVTKSSTKETLKDGDKSTESVELYELIEVIRPGPVPAAPAPRAQPATPLR